jgi:predicted  nucleic acid-binding Zn-ribbon protein
MWPFKSKYDKLTREEVVDSICSLERELSDLETDIMSTQSKIDALMAKGKAEKSNDMRIFIAKKINSIKADRQANIQRATYLMYNIQLLNKLKRAIDDNGFFKNNSKLPLAKLLSDQKGLAVFLNKALNTRVEAENVLTSADEVFRSVEESYLGNDEIYGAKSQDAELLAMFETEDMLGDVTFPEEVAVPSVEDLENMVGK